MKVISRRGIIKSVFMMLMVVAIVSINVAPVTAAETIRKSQKLYTTTFTFDPKDYKGDITSIGVMGEFLFYYSNLTGNTDKTGMVDVQKKYMPSEYKEGMKSVGGFYYQEMTFDESKKVYTTTITLPAGMYNYHFQINTKWGDVVAQTEPTAFANSIFVDGTMHGIASFAEFGDWVADPKNMPNVATLTGGQRSSQLYVGTSADYPWIPISKASKRGTVSFVTYTDINNTTQSIGVYLPVGYDKNATKPYKVIYVSHGGGGNENDWFSQGGINNIMDNLIAQGKTQDAILVTMNNNVYSWDFPKIADNMLKKIIPHMEKVYNVSKSTKDRAFCGLSMGSMTTLYMYMHHADKFQYFGAFSGGLAGGEHFDLSSKYLNKVKLMIGSGEEDMAYNTRDIGVPTYIKRLDENNIKYIPYFVPGAHDWFTWPQMFTYFADRVLWTK